MIAGMLNIDAASANLALANVDIDLRSQALL